MEHINQTSLLKTIRRNNAFSLVELLVVMVIIILLTGYGLASYNRFNDQKLIDSESKKILNLLETARSKAMTRDLDTQEVSVCDFQGYRLTINPTSMVRKYTLQIICNNTYSSVRENDMIAVATIQTFPTNPITIDFAADLGNSSCTGSGCSIIISNQRVGACKQINISPTGLIEEKPC